MTRQYLESEVEITLDSLWLANSDTDPLETLRNAKTALLSLIDRYVEEQESELAKNMLRQADYMVKDGELVHAVATEDIKSVVPSLSALRQQVKGGE